MAEMRRISPDAYEIPSGEITGDADEAALARRRFEGSLQIGMQVSAMLHALHQVEVAAIVEKDMAALADAEAGLDMVCRQMRRTRARLGLQSPA